MNINRHNYEEYFLLYVDNELTATEKRAVEEFVLQNSDLEEELVMLKQSVIHPNPHIVFDKKEALLKNVPTGVVNESNYEEYFVLYSDNEITNNQKELVEQFVDKHPQYREEFELIQQAKLLPDNSLVFPDKNYLYRTEEDEKVVPFPWRKLAVAAVILLFMGGFGWYVATTNHPGTPAGPNSGKTTNGIARTDTNNAKKNTPANDQLAVSAEKKDSSKQQLPTNTVAAAQQDDKKKAASPDNKSLAAVNYLKKINPSPGNNQKEINVPHIEEPVATLESPKERTHTITRVNTENISETRPVVDVAVNQRNAKQAREDLDIQETTVVYVDAQPDDEVYADNNPSNKRPLRGFFRKVTRVFDKATNRDDGENNKKGIRIANFEIALNK